MVVDGGWVCSGRWWLGLWWLGLYWAVVVGFMVVGFSKNRFLHAIPNTENTFLANFPKHKQTTENIFLFINIFD